MGSIEAYGHATSGEKFYDELAEQAKAASVTVNVISMEGTDCRLALLGKLADKTNGVLTIVNPLKLGAKFASILVVVWRREKRSARRSALCHSSCK